MITLTKNPSTNSKLGWGVWATYREVGKTCPPTCKALKSGACYALYGNVGRHQRRSAQDEADGDALKRWLSDLPRRALVRHHVSGDVFDNREGLVGVDWVYVMKMVEGHQENPQIKGWGYTHAWRQIEDPALINVGNLTVNASCDSVDEADEAFAAGWPTTVVVPEDAERFVTPLGVTVTICPAQLDAEVKCSHCMLCHRGERNQIVGFRLHGTGKDRWTQE